MRPRTAGFEGPKLPEGVVEGVRRTKEAFFEGERREHRKNKTLGTKARIPLLRRINFHEKR